MTPKPAPNDLNSEARALWDRFAADLVTVGGGSTGDWLELENLIRTAERLGQIRDQLTEDGVTVTGSKGQIRPHPLVAVESSLAREFRTGLDRLGLSLHVRTWPLTVGDDGQLQRPNEWDDDEEDDY